MSRPEGGTESDNEIVVLLSKTKLVAMVCGSIAFLLGSILLWRISETQKRPNPVVVKGAAVLGASFFGVCALYGVYKLCDSRPGLIISRAGIFDNSNASAVGWIAWSDVSDITVISVSGQEMLVIKVVNPERYIERGNRCSRMLRKANMRLSGSPVTLSPHALRINLNDLQDALNEAVEKYTADGLL